MGGDAVGVSHICSPDLEEEDAAVLRRRLELMEMEREQLRANIRRLTQANKELLEIPISREAFRRELFKKFHAFVENRVRFHRMLEEVTKQCISARKTTNVVTIGVGSVGIAAALQRFARTAGSVVPLLATAFSFFLFVNGHLNEAAQIKKLETVEETDFKLISQLLGAYEDYCTMFNVERRIGRDDVMRMHMEQLIPQIVQFIGNFDLSEWKDASADITPRDFIEFGFAHAITPVVAHISSGSFNYSLESIHTAIGSTAASIALPNITSSVRAIGILANGFCVVNALRDLLMGSESNVVKNMKLFIEQQKHELALFEGALGDQVDVVETR